MCEIIFLLDGWIEHTMVVAEVQFCDASQPVVTEFRYSIALVPSKRQSYSVILHI